MLRVHLTEDGVVVGDMQRNQLQVKGLARHRPIVRWRAMPTGNQDTPSCMDQFDYC